MEFRVQFLSKLFVQNINNSLYIKDSCFHYPTSIVYTYRQSKNLRAIHRALKIYNLTAL